MSDMEQEYAAENGAGRVPEYTHRANWRRAFCRWWGHEYVHVIEPVTVQIELRCLRCYGGGTIPFRPTLTRVTPPGSSAEAVESEASADE